MKNLWRIWAKSLGEKASDCDKESDIVAIVRTFIFLTYLTTNIAIVSNAIRHWNDNQSFLNIEQFTMFVPEIEVELVERPTSPTEIDVTVIPSV